MNCVLYARVSTDRQADLSIPAQLEAMRGYAHQKHWTVSEEFVEPGASAKTTERPALQRLLTRVRDSKRKTDVVVVHKIDRLARNVYDHATIKALLKQQGIQLASVVENVDDTVPGQLVENIMASIAQFYSANLSEEVKKGMRQKVLKGGWPHLPPCGYVSVRNPDGRGARIEVHPRKGPLIVQMFDLYATGNYSLRALSECLAKEGLLTRTGQPLPQSNIQRLLTNPFYAGRVVWQGMDVPGRHAALVSPLLFERVQKLVIRRFRDVGKQGTVPGFPLRGVAICASCRGRMTAERHDRWGYYRCSRQTYKKERCRAKFSNADRVHDDLKRVCIQIQITRTLATAIAKQAALTIASRSATRDERLKALDAEAHARAVQEMELTDAFTTGNITPDAYKGMTDRLRFRRIEIQDQLGRAPIDDEQLNNRVRQILDVATSVWDLYQPLDDRRRTELLSAVFKNVVLGPEGIIGFSLRSPFAELRTGSDAKAVAAAVVEALEAA